MNFDNLNKWLTLIANIGVLAGIIFLSLEIDQSNRIAVREARSELLTDRNETNRSAFENPEIAGLMVKLRTSDAELTEIEEYRAYSFAMLQLTQAISLNASYEEGFLSDEILARNLGGARNVIRNIPGIAPYLRQAIEQLGLTDVVFGQVASPALKNLGDEVLRIEEIDLGSR
jgi:hypothetical protein